MLLSARTKNKASSLGLDHSVIPGLQSPGCPVFDLARILRSCCLAGHELAFTRSVALMGLPYKYDQVVKSVATFNQSTLT